METLEKRVGVVEPCQNCGEKGHEHTKEMVEHSNGRKKFRYVCPK